MRLLIAGSRHLDISPGWLGEVLDGLFGYSLEMVESFVTGDCPTGVDAAARRYCAGECDEAVKRIAVHKAEWERGRCAGPMRNRRMAEDATQGLVIWDGKSRGSASMIREMAAAGKPCWQIIVPEPGSVEGRQAPGPGAAPREAKEGA